MLDKLEKLKYGLLSWSKVFRNKKVKFMNKLTSKLDELMTLDRDDATLSSIIDTKIRLNWEIEKDEVFWEQRARANWLRLGDKNTVFFHKFVSARRHMNQISRLDDENGYEVMDDNRIGEVASQYFQTLFTFEAVGDASHILSSIKVSINSSINDKLMTPFTVKEVYDALKTMGPTKAPGADGYRGLFFQRY